MRPTSRGLHYTPSPVKRQVHLPQDRYHTTETDAADDDLLVDFNSNVFNTAPVGKAPGCGLMNSLDEETDAGVASPTGFDSSSSKESNASPRQRGAGTKKRVVTLPVRPPSRPSTGSKRPSRVVTKEASDKDARVPSRPSSVASQRRPDVVKAEGKDTAQEESRPASKPKKRTTTLTSDRGDGPGEGDESPVRRAVRPPLQRRASTVGTVSVNDLSAGEAAPARPRPEGFSRQLSFVDVTTDEMVEVMESEAPGQDWLQGFWFRVLSAPAVPESRSLALRTLTNWVQIYNRWQGKGGWKAEKTPQICDAVDMQEILGIPMSRVMEFVKWFDPSGYARVMMSKSPQDYAKVKIPVAAFLTACILLSTAISKQNKIRFLLGIFDENDNLHLEEGEFVSHIQAIFTGLAALFSLKGSPPTQRIETFAKFVFARIADSAHVSDKTSLPFQAIEEWLTGEVLDAVNLPFALFLQRFSIPREEEDPDRFEDDDRKFRLSHTCPVPCPMETQNALDASFLNRNEVVLAEAIYNRCISTATWHMSHAQAELAANQPIDAEFWINKLHRALDDMDTARGLGVKMTLTTFFKKLCPRATHLHLRMFHNWLKEAESLEELKKEAAESLERSRIFQEYVNRAVLPAKVRQDLLKGWENTAADGPDAMEKEEYVARFCPSDLRAHAGHRLVDEVLGKLLASHAATQQETAEQKEQLFAPRRAMESRTSRKVDFVRPQVSAEEWQSWEQVLDLLEVNDAVTPMHLHRTRLVCPELVEHIHALVSNENAFTRDAFLKTMLLMTSQRAPAKSLTSGGTR